METRLYSDVEREEPEVAENNYWKMERLQPRVGAPALFREIQPLTWTCNLHVGSRVEEPLGLCHILLANIFFFNFM